MSILIYFCNSAFNTSNPQMIVLQYEFWIEMGGF